MNESQFSPLHPSKPGQCAVRRKKNEDLNQNKSLIQTYCRTQYGDLQSKQHSFIGFYDSRTPNTLSLLTAHCLSFFNRFFSSFLRPFISVAQHPNTSNIATRHRTIKNCERKNKIKYLHGGTSSPFGILDCCRRCCKVAQCRIDEIVQLLPREALGILCH